MKIPALSIMKLLYREKNITNDQLAYFVRTAVKESVYETEFWLEYIHYEFSLI
jgi:hypothetical protein